LTVRRTGFREAPQGKTLESEWGLALHLESRKGEESRRYLLDFGFTPDVYSNNLELMKIDVSQVDAPIVSHGHYDHVGGLVRFLDSYRPRMRKELHLYTGGEDNFCYRFNHNYDGGFSAFGNPLDRHKLAMLNVQPALSEAPITVEGHAFTTDAVPRTSIEHVLPNTGVEYGVQRAGLRHQGLREPPFHRRRTRRQAGPRSALARTRYLLSDRRSGARRKLARAGMPASSIRSDARRT